MNDSLRHLAGVTKLKLDTLKKDLMLEFSEVLRRKSLDLKSARSSADPTLYNTLLNSQLTDRAPPELAKDINIVPNHILK